MDSFGSFGSFGFFALICAKMFKCAVFDLNVFLKMGQNGGGGGSEKIISRRSRLSRTTSDSSRLIRPRPIDCDSGHDCQMKIFPLFLPISLFKHRQKKFLFSCLLPSHDLHSPVAEFS